MCGFVAQLKPVSPEFVKAAGLTEHRGTRGRMVESEAGTIYHARLPIVGLDASFDQPVCRVTGQEEWYIAFVGEVLDFKERDPRLACDLNVVTRAWVTRGAFGLTAHDGFWSVVALSSAKKNLHVSCDYLAQKPAYYRQDVRAAASELDAIAALGPVTPDEVYFAAVVKWGYCPEVERTPYREVKHVLPGEHVILQADGQVRRRVTDPLEPIPCTPEELKAEVEAAVKRRVLSSDVPVACLLSGGLDSSIAYTLAKRHGNVRAYYATEGGLGTDIDESLAVSAVLNGDKNYSVIPWTNVDPAAALSTMQEPIDLGSLIPQVALSQAISETVCLTGDGADEAFGGYGRAERYDSQASDLFHELPAWHLPRLDRVMMRHRIEVRSPFLARRVVQMAMGLPRRLRTDKIILRDLFRDDLPPTIAYRKKKPLRTSTVEVDREANSKRLVEAFRRSKWPETASG